jgi:hypothetical protein
MDISTTAARLAVIADFKDFGLGAAGIAYTVLDMAEALERYYDDEAEMEAAHEAAYINAFRWTYEYDPQAQDEMRRDDERAFWFAAA